ncbi:MAG: hypothetical protein KDB01_13210 [Planctomycetaceae bacterium]|nr:hypothetical protein [Planctomycetaceae bacterium]
MIRFPWFSRLATPGLDVAYQSPQRNENVGVVVLVDADDLRCFQGLRLAQLFRRITSIIGPLTQRISIPRKDHSMMNHPPVSPLAQLPRRLMRQLQRADAVVIAPMTTADVPLLFDILVKLSQSSRIILQLSAEQFNNQEECHQLMRLASVTILNDTKAMTLSGQTQITRAIEHFQRHRAGNIVVTSQSQAHAWLDGNYYILPAFPVEKVVRTVGVGDVFTTHFASAMTHHCSWHKCLRIARKAAADYVEGKTATALPDNAGPRSAIPAASPAIADRSLQFERLLATGLMLISVTVVAAGIGRRAFFP